LLSLLNSNIYDSIAKRLGTALIAHGLISQYNSVALDDFHWVTEAERLFATSLARIQFDAMNIASGEDWVHVGQDGYVDKTPDEAGDLCGIFKFKSTGYTNIDLWAFNGAWLACLFIWLLSVVVSRATARHKAKEDGANVGHDAGQRQVGYGTIAEGQPGVHAPEQGAQVEHHAQQNQDRVAEQQAADIADEGQVQTDRNNADAEVERQQASDA
jgi:hypothetical protein